MIVGDRTALCKGFALCTGFVTANDEVVVTVDSLKREGTFSQLFYGVMGSAKLYDLKGNLLLDCKEGNFYDMRDFYHIGGYVYKTGSEEGGSWFCINPFPSNKIYDYKVLNEGDTESVFGDGVERAILCVKGRVNINDKTLQQKQYARILKDKMATYTIEKDSLAVYFWDSGKRQG
jgi:hypothetical protein